MPIKTAKRIVNQTEEKESMNFHFIPVDKDYYREISNQIRKKILEDFSKRIEQGSREVGWISMRYISVGVKIYV